MEKKSEGEPHMNIEIGLPVARRAYNVPPGPKLKFPEIAMLNIDESFFAPQASVYQMSSLAGYHAKKLNQKFVCRTVTENMITGVRVFRVR
jgi:hypothetical protein